MVMRVVVTSETSLWVATDRWRKACHVGGDGGDEEVATGQRRGHWWKIFVRWVTRTVAAWQWVPSLHL